MAVRGAALAQTAIRDLFLAERGALDPEASTARQWQAVRQHRRTHRDAPPGSPWWNGRCDDAPVAV